MIASNVSTEYESPIAWNPSRLDTVVISCVDGRWRQHVQDFAINHLKAGLNSDFMAVPGGIEPLTLSESVPQQVAVIAYAEVVQDETAIGRRAPEAA